MNATAPRMSIRTDIKGRKEKEKEKCTHLTVSSITVLSWNILTLELKGTASLTIKELAEPELKSFNSFRPQELFASLSQPRISEYHPLFSSGFPSGLTSVFEICPLHLSFQQVPLEPNPHLSTRLIS